MTANQVIEHFGSITAVAKALGIKPPSVHEWTTRKRVPWLSQLEIEEITKGKLRHNPEAIPVRYRKYVRAPKARRA